MLKYTVKPLPFVCGRIRVVSITYENMESFSLSKEQFWTAIEWFNELYNSISL